MHTHDLRHSARLAVLGTLAQVVADPPSAEDAELVAALGGFQDRSRLRLHETGQVDG